MRNATRFMAMLALILFFAQPSPAQQVRTIDDDGWCDNNWGGRDEHHCLVLEASMRSDGIRIDDLSNGSVAVQAWDGDEIRLRARVVGRADDEDRARELAESVRLRINGDDVDADGPRSHRDESWWVSYRLEVPRNTDMEFETSNGSISIDRVQGRMRLRTSNGAISLVGVGGDVQGRTSNGAIKLELAGTTWEGSGLELGTSNGSVRIEVPEGYNAVLETGTSNGGIDVDFPVQMTRHSRRRMTLQLGNGGPELAVTTSNGSVRIERG